MRWLLRLRLRLRTFVRRSAVEAELDEELRFHLERETESLVRQGLAPEQARLEALRAFGGVERYKEECRDARGLRLVDDLRQDLRFGLRSLRKSPGFAVVSVATLGLGIGLSATVFGVVDGVLLKPLPYAHPQDLVVLWQHDRKAGDVRDDVSPPNFLDLRDRTTVFAAMAAAEPFGLDYPTDDGPVTLKVWLVSQGFFDVLGTPALVGRTFRQDEYTAGHERVVILGHGAWRRRFGGDPSVVGRTLSLDGVPYTVVGVMPPEFQFPSGKELWAPRVFGEGDRREQLRAATYLTVVARLNPRTSREVARAELATVAAQLAREHPRANADVGIMLLPLSDQLFGGVRRALLVLLGAVGLVLLGACINVASLSLARAIRREHELAVRVALGAARGRIVRQLLAESLVLTTIGCAAGVLLAHWGIAAVRAMSPADLPRAEQMVLDARVLAYAVSAALLTVSVSGLLPALRSARADLREGLRAGGRGASPGRASHRLRGALVVAQVALSLMLLVGAGLLARSFVSLLRVERGYRPDHVLAINIFVWGHYETGPRRAEFVRQATDRIGALPGVRSVGVSSSLPLSERIGPEDASVAVEGAVAPGAGQGTTVRAAVATGGYFETLRIPLRRGRLFSSADDARAVPVAVISESMAHRLFPGRDALGRRLVVSFAGPPEIREVVGVVGDVRHEGLDRDPHPTLYVPHAQSPTGALTFTVRTDGDAAAMLAAVQRQIWTLDRSLPIYGSATMEGLLGASLRARRFNLALLACFALTALVLSAVGVYGVMSQAAGERTHEMGVRMAFGAEAADVLALMLRQGMTLALVGVTIGFLGAASLTGVLRGMLFAIAPLDPVTFGASAALVLGMAAAAALVPALRATRVSPVEALRGE